MKATPGTQKASPGLVRLDAGRPSSTQAANGGLRIRWAPLLSAPEGIQPAPSTPRELRPAAAPGTVRQAQEILQMAIARTRLTAEGFEFEFQVESNRVYSIEVTDNLIGSGYWITLATVYERSGLISVVDTNLTSARVFYRIGITPTESNR